MQFSSGQRTRPELTALLPSLHRHNNNIAACIVTSHYRQVAKLGGGLPNRADFQPRHLVKQFDKMSKLADTASLFGISLFPKTETVVGSLTRNRELKWSNRLPVGPVMETHGGSLL